MSGAGLNQLLDCRSHGNQQLGLCLPGLLDHSRLLGNPLRRSGLAAIDVVKRSQTRGSERRKVLRQRSNFLEQ